MVRLFLIFLAFCTNSFANDIVYKGNGHYGDIILSERGDDSFLLKTCGFYEQICLGIVALAIKSEANSNIYTTEHGQITALYGSKICTYPIRLTLSFSEDSLYISEYGPGYFPKSAIGCPTRDILRYSHYIEQKKYIRAQ